MATIYFKRIRGCGPSYLSLIAVRDAKPGDPLLTAAEYRVVCGDIGVADDRKREQLKTLRADMRREGHHLVEGNPGG